MLGRHLAAGRKQFSDCSRAARWLLAGLAGATPIGLHAQSPPVRVTYGASAGSVSESGVYVAPADTGTAIITVEGPPSTDTIRVPVLQSAPRADPPARPRPDTELRPKDGLWLDEDFSRYTSIDQYRSNPFGWTVSGPKWFHQEQMALDKGQGYSGSPQSLRYDWPGGPACKSDYAIVSSYRAPPVPEVWVEVVHKFATTFNTNTRSAGGSCGFGEYKFVLLWRTIGDRFDLINGHLGREWWSKNPQSPAFGHPPDCAGPNRNCRVPALGSDMHWDGQWHVYRFHIRFNSAQGVADGVYQVWVDGRLVNDVQRVDLTESHSHKWSNRLKEIFLGSNSNSGTSRPTQTWWGRLRIYTSDPGW